MYNHYRVKCMSKKVEKMIKKELTGITLVFAIIFLIIGLIGGFISYSLLNREGETKVELKGDYTVRLEIGEEFVESGYTFIIDDVDYSKDVTINGTVDTETEGTYVLVYSLDKDGHKVELTRVVNVRGGVSNG